MLINAIASNAIASTVPSPAALPEAAATVSGISLGWSGQAGGAGLAGCQQERVHQPDGIAARASAQFPSVAKPASVGFAGTGFAGTGFTGTGRNGTDHDNCTYQQMTRLIPAARGGLGSLPAREPEPA